MTVSSPPPSFLWVSLWLSSFHWYISTLRTSRGGLGRDAEVGIDERRRGLEVAHQMDQLAVIGGVDAARIDLDHETRPLGERARGLDGAALVPEQKDDGREHEHEPDDHADRSLHEALEPGLARDFSELVGCSGILGCAPAGVAAAEDVAQGIEGARCAIGFVCHLRLPAWTGSGPRRRDYL